jgi:hypothetical protein
MTGECSALIGFVRLSRTCFCKIFQKLNGMFDLFGFWQGNRYRHGVGILPVSPYLFFIPQSRTVEQ